jgi:hypothetical protein
MSTTRTQPKSRWTVEQWNERFPVGTQVEYRAAWGQETPTLETRTRSQAWGLPHGEGIVLIDGRSGGVALWALEPANPLRYCANCDQRRRGSKSDPAHCSHCRNPLPAPTGATTEEG